MLFSYNFNKAISKEALDKVTNEALVTIASEAKKNGIRLDQMSSLALAAYLKSIQPTLTRLADEQGREKARLFIVKQNAMLTEAKLLLANILDTIS